MKKLVVHYYANLFIILIVFENNQVSFCEILNPRDSLDREDWIYVGRKSQSIGKKESKMSEKFIELDCGKGFLPNSSQDSNKNEDFIAVQIKRNKQEFKGFLLKDKLILKGDYIIISQLKKGGNLKFSRKIESESLKKEFSKLKPFIWKNIIVIIRKFAIETNFQDLLLDYRRVSIRWYLLNKKIDSKIKERKTGCIFSRSPFEKSLCEIRNIEKVETNNLRKIKKILPYLKSFTGSVSFKSSLSQSVIKILLKSLSTVISMGKYGFITIQKTELGWIIDVNSGSKNTEVENIESLYFKCNLEAVNYISKEILFRNMVGLIIIDLINMESDENNYFISDKLRELSLMDKNRIKINNINEEGIAILVRESKHTKPEIQPLEKQCLRLIFELELQILKFPEDKFVIEIHKSNLMNYFLNNFWKGSIDYFGFDKLQFNFKENDDNHFTIHRNTPERTQTSNK